MGDGAGVIAKRFDFFGAEVQGRIPTDFLPAIILAQHRVQDPLRGLQALEMLFDLLAGEAGRKRVLRVAAQSNHPAAINCGDQRACVRAIHCASRDSIHCALPHRLLQPVYEPIYFKGDGIGWQEEKLNIEHRTSNVEHRTMKSLRSIFLKLGKIPFSTLDVGRSMFDVHLF